MELHMSDGVANVTAYARIDWYVGDLELHHHLDGAYSHHALLWPMARQEQVIFSGDKFGEFQLVSNAALKAIEPPSPQTAKAEPSPAEEILVNNCEKLNSA